MNDQSGEFEGCAVKPYEYYVFLKPRMWEQYADNYQGVCLAFSRSELKNAFKDNFQKPTEFYSQDIKYKKYNILELDSTGRSDLNEIRDVGFEKYEKGKMKLLKHTLFNKHIDYQGENEFRICSNSQNEFDYLDISKA